MSPKVLGLDLSLTCTGLAGDGWTDTIRPGDRRGADRLMWIRDTLTDRWLANVDLAVVEGPSYGSAARQSGHHERAGLWWLVRCALASRGVPTAVVAPACLKRYATGKGNAGKDRMVLEAARRFSWFEGTEDEADALWLAAAGTDHLGHPYVTMPAHNRDALEKVEWPTVKEQIHA